jgi:hypothetical protein
VVARRFELAGIAVPLGSIREIPRRDRSSEKCGNIWADGDVLLEKYVNDVP